MCRELGSQYARTVLGAAACIVLRLLDDFRVAIVKSIRTDSRNGSQHQGLCLVRTQVVVFKHYICNPGPVYHLVAH
jgi:hypothetical protein